MSRLIMFLFLCSFLSAQTCAELMKKYHTPDPTIKTMKQLKRWVRRKMRNSPDKNAVLQCLLQRAADNPNKAEVAGE